MNNIKEILCAIKKEPVLCACISLMTYAGCWFVWYRFAHLDISELQMWRDDWATLLLHIALLLCPYVYMDQCERKKK